MYGIDPDGTSVPPDQLALLYIIFAMGSYYNLELPPDDSSVEDYVQLSRCCLAKADFLSRNTIAAVQTLVSFTHTPGVGLTSAHHGPSPTVSGA